MCSRIPRTEGKSCLCSCSTLPGLPEAVHVDDRRERRGARGGTYPAGERQRARGSLRQPKVEKRFSVTERECLALVWATRRFKVYLQGRHFLLRTDHNPLVHLRQSKDPRGKLAQWMLELEALDYELLYQPGASLPHADALSRGPVDDPGEGLVEARADAEVRATTLDSGYRVKLAQHDDEDLKQVMTLLRDKRACPASASPAVKHYITQNDQMQVDQEGLLLCKYVRHGQEHRQVVVPKAQVEEILTLCRDDLSW